MKKRNLITLIIALCWVAFVGCTFLFNVALARLSSDFTTFNDAAADDDGYTYIADNNSRGGLVYKLDSKGKTVALFATQKNALFSGWSLHKIEFADTTPWGVLGRVRNDNGREVQEYEIIRFNTELGATHRSPVFRLTEGLKLTGFSVYDGDIFLTAVSANGQEVYVFRGSDSSMVEITKTNLSQQEKEQFDSLTISFSQIDDDLAGNGRFYTQAEYADNVLYTRSDDSEPEGRFAVDPTVRSLFEDRSLSFGQLVTVSGVVIPAYIIAAIAGAILIILISFLLRARRRVAYAFALYEVVIAILIGGTFWFILKQERNVTIEGYERFEEYSLGTLFDGLSEDASLTIGTVDFYDTEEYVLLQNRIASQVEASSGTVEMRDIVVVNQGTGEVIFSGSGRNRQGIAQVYGAEAAQVTVDVNDQQPVALSDAVLQGETLTFLARSLADTDLKGYAVLGVTANGNITDSFFANYGNAFRLTLIIFVIASLLGLLFFALESYDIRQLAFALRDLAAGRENIRKPVVIGRDMSMMWNSLFEVQKNINMSNRIKFLTYEAYYRFAPKSIEKILQKDSITEVKSGDAVELKGTMAMLSTVGQVTVNENDIAQMNHLLELIVETQNQQGGIFISSDSDLSMMKLLFPDESRAAGGFAVDLLERLREWKQREFSNTTVFMCYAPYVYGVVGTETQASAFLSSPQAEALEPYVDWFRELRLGLVITESVLKHEETKYDVRYIGYVTPDPDDTEKKVELYEVLDACSVRERQSKLLHQKQFADALDLYYHEDFYTARNAFTDILREAPDDEVVKWYLFECERCFNSEDNTGFSGALHR